MAPPSLPKKREVRLPENEELAGRFLEKHRSMVADGLSENLERTLSTAYRELCASKRPIRTPRDMLRIKGIGPWVIRIMKDSFPPDSSQDLSPQEGNKRKYVPRKSSPELFEAGMRVYRTLWPESATPATIAELSKCLLAVETRLREWRSSSARAGADLALTIVLSWYESIDLNVLKSLRSGSQWTSDPQLIQSRKEAASFMANYAQTQSIIPGPVYSDDEEDDAEEEEDDDEEEEVDEEIEAELPDTAEQPAADISSEAASDITGDPVTTTTVDPATEIAHATPTAPTDPSSSHAAV